MTGKNDQKIADLDAQEKRVNDQIDRIEKLLKDQEEAKAAQLAGGGAAPGYVVAGNRTGSIEAKTLAAFGKTHVKDLLNVNVAHPHYARIDPVHKSIVSSLKEAIDISRFIAQVFYDGAKDKVGTDEKSERIARLDGIMESYYAKEVLAPMLKAFGTGVVGAGAEWIPTAISSQFIEEFELEKRVAMAFREMPMPTNPFKLSVQNGITTARIATENTAMTQNNFGTATIDFDATKLGEFYILPEELNEDSAPAIMSIARSEVAEAQVRARETAILNGDDSGTHMDNDVTAADDARKLAKGLRKLALDNSANGAVVTFGSAVTTAKLDEMRKAAGKYGINPRDTAFIFSPSGYHQAVALDEVSSVDQIGNNATLISGTLASFRGVPVMISEYVREDLDSTGVNSATPANNVKAAVHLVNMRRFWVGMRRPIRVRVMQDLADQDRWLMSSYSRIDFQGHAQSATETSTILGVDVVI